MKKTYIVPKVECTKLQIVSILAASPSYGDTTDLSEGNLARDFDFEEEEEY